MIPKFKSLTVLGAHEPFSMILGKKIEKTTRVKEHRKPALKPGFSINEQGFLCYKSEVARITEAVDDFVSKQINQRSHSDVIVTNAEVDKSGLLTLNIEFTGLTPVGTDTQESKSVVEVPCTFDYTHEVLSKPVVDFFQNWCKEIRAAIREEMILSDISNGRSPIKSIAFNPNGAGAVTVEQTNQPTESSPQEQPKLNYVCYYDDKLLDSLNSQGWSWPISFYQSEQFHEPGIRFDKTQIVNDAAAIVSDASNDFSPNVRVLGCTPNSIVNSDFDQPECNEQKSSITKTGVISYPIDWYIANAIDIIEKNGPDIESFSRRLDEVAAETCHSILKNIGGYHKPMVGFLLLSQEQIDQNLLEYAAWFKTDFMPLEIANSYSGRLGADIGFFKHYWGNPYFLSNNVMHWNRMRGSDYALIITTKTSEITIFPKQKKIVRQPRP